MANVGDGFRDIFLAGIGAMAITGEKTKDLIEQLVSRGELTVDQGKQINTELRHKAAQAAETVRYDALEARMAAMTPEERAAFAAKAAELADAQNAAAAKKAEADAAGQDAPADEAPAPQQPAADDGAATA